MKYDFITVGGTTEDITFYSEECVVINNKEDVLKKSLLAFQYGAKVKIDKADSTFGGGASNVAVCLSSLGLDVGTVVSIGDDLRGRKIVQNFKDRGVDTNYIQKVDNKETGFSFLLIGPGNEHIVFSNRAANNELKIGDREMRLFKRTKWIYVSSLSGKWIQVLNKVFSSNAKIAWNPGKEQLNAGFDVLSKYLRRVDMLSINKEEATRLALSHEKSDEKSDNYFSNIKNLLKIIHEYGPKIVVITNGRYGASAYDGKNFYRQEVFKERRRLDTTGVGDAFGSTFAAGLEFFNGDIKKALKLGAKQTASVISRYGAQNGLLSRTDIESLISSKKTNKK